MPWCPGCKMEYREGITECSDCKMELVEELREEDSYVPFFQAETKNVADKLKDYFDYSGLKSIIRFDMENEVFVLSIPPEKQKQAKKLYQAFYFVERERLDNEQPEQSSDPIEETAANGTDTDKSLQTDTSSDEFFEDFIDPEEIEKDEDTVSEEDEEKDIAGSGAYVMKEDQFKDLSSTVWIFLLFGIAGIFVVVLNVVGIFTFLYGPLPNIIMGALFLFFIYVGLSTNKKAKQIQSEIDTENKLTKEINSWLEFNINEHFVTSLHNDQISEELNYIHISTTIKKMLIKEFGDQNSAYLDRLIEEYYSKTFD